MSGNERQEQQIVQSPKGRDGRQVEAMRKRLRELAFLHETSQVLTATLDLDSVLHALMAQVRDYFQVEVKDNGIGFEVATIETLAVASHAYGLFSIRERLSHLGGRMRVDSNPGRGTTITLEVPLPPNERTEEVCL